MKKIKTLLPIATISLLSTSIAPIASCSNSQITITNESIGVTLIDLPISMSKNIDLECKYKIDDPSYMIDETKSDILVSGSSIKAKDKVEYLNDRIFIPKQYTNGNITIKLITKKDTSSYSLTNESDSDITLYELPSTISRGQKIVLSYTTPLDRKIDVANSIVKIADTEYKGDEIVKYTSNTITIPAEIVKGNVVLMIKSTDVVYNITNLSSSEIEFENLPTTIKHGYTLNVPYTIKNDKVIDTANSDIICDGQSIKNKSGVIYDKGILQVNSQWITNDLTIKLAVREKQKVNIYPYFSHVTINDLPSEKLEGSEITGHYTVDNTYLLDITNSTILCNGISIKDYPGVEWKDGTIKIPGNLVNGPIIIVLIANENREITTSWANIVSACNAYETSDRGTEATNTFLNSFEINGAKPTSLDQLIGATKRIKFYKDSEQEHFVKIIGYNYDKYDDGSENTSALTFELDGLFTDESGDYLLSWYRNDDEENPSSSYEESDLYNHLNSEEDVNWLQKNRMESITAPSCLSLLTDAESSLASGIKNAVRKLSKYNGTDFELVDQKAKLFPLSYSSMGFEVPESGLILKEGNPYQYYSDVTRFDRIKADLNGDVCNYWLSTPYKVIGLEEKVLATQVCYVQESGDWQRTGTRPYFGVSFAFCI